MAQTTQTGKRDLSVMELVQQARFVELQKISMKNPQLRQMLLHWRGLRHTAFFRKRLRFYRQFAKKWGIRKFLPETKNQLRREFAKQHNLQAVLKRAFTPVQQKAKTFVPLLKDITPPVLFHENPLFRL